MVSFIIGDVFLQDGVVVGSPRLGGITFILGGLLAILGNILHPRGEMGELGALSRDTEAQLIVNNLGAWYPSHVALTLSVPLLLLGYVSLYFVLLNKGQQSFSTAALVALGLGQILLLVAIALDGFLTPILAQNYQASTGAAKEIAGATLDYNFLLSLILLAPGFLSLTAGIGLFATSLLKAKLFNQGFAGVGVALGLIGVGGYLGGLFGPYWVLSSTFAPFALAFTIWGVVAGIFLYRAP